MTHENTAAESDLTTDRMGQKHMRILRENFGSISGSIERGGAPSPAQPHWHSGRYFDAASTDGVEATRRAFSAPSVPRSADRNPPGLGFLRFRQRQRQYPIIELRTDPLLVDLSDSVKDRV